MTKKGKPVFKVIAQSDGWKFIGEDKEHIGIIFYPGSLIKSNGGPSVFCDDFLQLNPYLK